MWNASLWSGKSGRGGLKEKLEWEALPGEREE